MRPDLSWNDVRSVFDPDLMGALPDLCVPGTTADDWQALLDLVAAQGWPHEYQEGQTTRPLPTARAVLARPPDAECPALQVWPAPAMLAIFRFYATDEIDFDVDVREIQGQQRLDEFCHFLRVIGRHLGKPVLMGDEGGNPAAHPVLGYSPEADRVLAFDLPGADAG